MIDTIIFYTIVIGTAIFVWMGWIYIMSTVKFYSENQSTETYDYSYIMHSIRYEWSVEYGKVLAIKLSRNSSKFKGYTTADTLLEEILNPAEDNEVLFEKGLINLLDIPAIFDFNEETNEIILKESATKEQMYLWLTQLYFRDIRVKSLEDVLKL